MGRCKYPLSRQENEKLIELVRQNRALYDPTYTDHKDVTYLQSIWATIAVDMGKANMDGIEWKKKWRNLRDTYVKKMRGVRTNVNAVVCRSWRFFEQMSFLEPYLEDNLLPDDTNYHPPISDDTYSDTGSNRDEEESMCADGQDSAVPAPFVAETTPRSIISINNSNSSSTTKKRPRHEAPPASSASSAEACDEQWKLNERGGGYFVEAAAAPPAVAECYTARSAAQIFCDSCAVKMDRLPAKTQSFLQYQIAQLFFNAENPDVTPVTIIPLPEHCRASSAPQGVDKTT